MHIKTALAHAIIEGWEGEKNMAWAVHRAWTLTDDKKPEDQDAENALITQSLRVKRIHFVQPVRVFCGAFMRPLGDALFDRRNNQECLIVALRCLGISGRGMGKQTRSIAARSLSKKHDWNTVK